jgi:hypothetical protein
VSAETGGRETIPEKEIANGSGRRAGGVRQQEKGEERGIQLHKKMTTVVKVQREKTKEI